MTCLGHHIGNRCCFIIDPFQSPDRISGGVTSLHTVTMPRCQIQISQAAQACEYASSLNCANIFASVAWLPTGSAMFSGV